MTDSILTNTAVLNSRFAATAQPAAMQQKINFFPIFLRNDILLLNYASQARWESGQLVDADNAINNVALSWMGSDADSNGFVRLDDAIVMEDNQTYRALRTHPKWVNNGVIKGWFPWIQQNGTGTFKAQVGFLNGATGTDGVTFEVWVHYHVNGVENWVAVIKQPKTYSGQLLEISADLSKWANQQISIELRVDAGASSGRDWAAWINPRIEITLVQIPGPVIIGGSPTIYDDRYDAAKKWYLPDFALKQELKNSFFFTCFKNAEPDENGHDTYNGAINFVLDKKIPDAVNALVSANPTNSYNEIPLTNFVANFVLAFTVKQPVPYAGTVTINNNEYTLTLQPDSSLATADQEAYLERIFNFVSNADNAGYCTISINASYSGYVLKPVPNLITAYQNAYKLRMMSTAASNPELLHTTNTHQFMLQRILPVMTDHAEAAVAATNVVNQSPEQYVLNNAISFARTIANVNYPCSGANAFPDNYVLKDIKTSQLVPFACHLPFGDGSANTFTYSEFPVPNEVLSNYGVSAIYLNTYNYNYLIVPEKYIIMLEHSNENNQEDLLVPSAYLTTIVDASDPSKCSANFQFQIAPDISAFRLNQIKKLIADNTPAQNKKSSSEVTIEFPSTLDQSQPLVFNRVTNTSITCLGAYEFGVPGSNYFQLELRDVSIGDGSAGLIADTIKGQMGGASIISQMSFKIDNKSGVSLPAAIELSLANITGNGLYVVKNNADNTVYLLNQTLFDISLISFTTDAETILNPPVLVENNNVTINSTSLVAPAPVTPDNYLNIIPRYTYNAGKDYVNSILAEMRTDLQNVTDSIIVTNNTGLFTMYNIKQIDVVLYILPADETDFSKALSTISKSIVKDGSVNYFLFVLPVGEFSKKWSAVYSTNLIFSDGTNRQNNVQVIEDVNSIGKVINLTVSNLNLSKT